MKIEKERLKESGTFLFLAGAVSKKCVPLLTFFSNVPSYYL